MQFPADAPRLSIAELREKIGSSARLDPFAGWSLPELEGEVLPRGTLVELLGLGAREWLLSLFARHADTRIAWIEPALTLFPPAIEQRGVSLDRWLFVETEREWSWAMLRILRSKLFQFAVAPGGMIPARGADAFLRKLQIQSERAGTTLFFLSESATPLFGITHRIQIDSAREGPRPRVLKRKRG